MLLRISHVSTLFFAFLGFTACSGGGGSDGGGGSGGTASSCAEASAFCLTSCNLGCVQDGCELREIAQNQLLRFQFSQDVDPSSVDFTTISLRTSLGLEPAGDFVVEGGVVTFVPEVRTIGAATFFGFTPNESYILDLPGQGAEPALRSTSGDILTESFTCTLAVTQGLIDLDARPPEASVIAPLVVDEIDRDTVFVLEFSEVIDESPFVLNPTGPDAPVGFFLLARNPATGGCDFTSVAAQIFGSVRVESDSIANRSSLTFTPSTPLPSNRCVQARVTGNVRDVAGVPAVPRVFVFTTDASSQIEEEVVAVFDNADDVDLDRSSAIVTGNQVEFVRLGGDGRHGDFDFEDGFEIAPNEFVIDTGDPVPGNLNGFVREDLAQGNYFFTRMVIPPGVTVRFTGPFPAQIHVRGVCDIRGTLIFDGAMGPVPTAFTDLFNATGDLPGQLGGPGGPGGGSGGAGGQQCDGNGVQTVNNGSVGDSLQVASTHAFAGMEDSTAGRGSEVFPASGLASDVTFTFLSGRSGQVAHGGSGGGFVEPGGDGRAIESVDAVQLPGDPPPLPPGSVAGGGSLNFLPLPADTRSHFLVGGSGGGGGGSHPLGQTAAPMSPFIAGLGGGGGGGVAIFRVGREFAIQPSGALSARGGDGPMVAVATPPAGAVGAPGGGGSGGSILIQVARDEDIDLFGSLDVLGGRGGLINITTGVFTGRIEGGDGSPGVFRIEAPTTIPSADWPLVTSPAPSSFSSGQLSDEDEMVGFTSRVFATSQSVAPTYDRYVIEATINGVATTFSDDPEFGIPALPGAAIQFLIQGITIDPATQLPDFSTLQPPFGDSTWYRRVGATGVPGEQSLNNAGRSGFRWQILVDRAVAGGPVSIQSVRVGYRF